MAGDGRTTNLGFEEVFRRHFDYVWRVAHAVAGPGAADDVTQEAFLVVRRRLDEFDGGSLRAWLFTVVRNVARNYLRSQRRREARLRAVPEPAPARDPDDEVALRQAADLLDQFMDSLPARQREAFVAVELEGLTARAVAEALGVPTRTVYSRVRTAREAFARFTADQRAMEAAS
ncbi:MAG: sigma-70 family RNA polymerase sigma factor [Myxococcota bacterium]